MCFEIPCPYYLPTRFSHLIRTAFRPPYTINEVDHWKRFELNKHTGAVSYHRGYKRGRNIVLRIQLEHKSTSKLKLVKDDFRPGTLTTPRFNYTRCILKQNIRPNQGRLVPNFEPNSTIGTTFDLWIFQFLHKIRLVFSILVLFQSVCTW